MLMFESKCSTGFLLKAAEAIGIESGATVRRLQDGCFLTHFGMRYQELIRITSYPLVN